jgi:very-short-patch-repair endonuclease
VEIDGSSHDHRGEHDAERTEYLRDIGWREVRFSNEDVLKDPQVVVDAIARALMGSSDPDDGA